VPAGAEWFQFHEIKYDGYRLRVARDGDRVRLMTRGGYDWTRRFPWIAEAALRNRRKQFVIDGEAVVLGVDGSLTLTPSTQAGRTDSPTVCL
jgi:bifunctional non-homologous end joining protein LigD